MTSAIASGAAAALVLIFAADITTPISVAGQDGGTRKPDISPSVQGKNAYPPKLTGTFVLSERPTGPWVPDDIAFYADGSCAIDVTHRPRRPPSCQIYADGRIRFDSAETSPDSFTSAYRVLKYTLRISPASGSDLIYVRQMGPPHPTEAEVLGTYRAHSTLGDSAGELAPNHRFREHLVDLMPDHSYYEIEMDGTYTYVDGVITYFPEHSTSPQSQTYIRDFVVKKTKECLWIVDPFNDTPLCQKPVTTIDLPLPQGYKPAARR